MVPMRSPILRSQISDLKWRIAACVAVLLAAAGPAAAQYEMELRAKARLFTDAPVGVTALKSLGAGDARQYYVLTARGSTVLAYDAAGKLLKQYGTPVVAGQRPPKDAEMLFQYGADLDAACPKLPGEPAETTPACFLYVADRGANAVKVLSVGQASTPVVARTIPVVAPTSVAALAEGELAVATMRESRLVRVFNREGTLAREFGVAAEIAESAELNRFLNIGRLATDAAGYLYYAFSYRPDPTVRKYDRFGYAALEMELTSLDAVAASQSRRREISRLDEEGARAAAFKPGVGAIGVNAETQEFWLGVGGLLMHFGPDGGRIGLYRLFTAEGARIEASAILVEPDRLLVASDTLGIFEVAYPERSRPAKRP
jgi:hypothetical protein